MRLTIKIALLLTALLGLGEAQDRAIRSPATEREEMRIREFVIRPDEAQAERQYELSQERQFVEKANSFARLWTAFAKEYNEKKIFDAKLANKLTRAFHELENGDSWPHSTGRTTHGSGAK